jgi:hypothetical protein
MFNNYTYTTQYKESTNIHTDIPVGMKMNATRRMKFEAYLQMREVCFKLHINASAEERMKYKLYMKNSYTFCCKNNT